MANIDGSTAITTEQLKTVLNSLKTQRETIRTTYDSMIKQVLDSSSSCFSVAGLDQSSVNSAFADTFKKIDTNFDALINVLENDVIKRYSELAMAIQQMFGGDFAARLSELIGISSTNKR